MAWQGDGTFQRTNGTNSGDETWQDDAAAGTKILASRHDTHDQDLADGIAACLTKNGETRPTAHFLPNASATYNLGSKALQWISGFLSGGLVFKERADHVQTPAATYGELWLKSLAPNALYFTNDDGADIPISGAGAYGLGTALAVDTEHDITISVGEHLDSTRAVVMRLTTAITKRIDADWAVGTGNGGLTPSARTVADTPNASTTYHMFIIMDSTGLIDAGWDTSVTAANLLSDTGYTYYYRVGSYPVDASSNLVGFSQLNNEFLLLVPIRSINDTSPGTSANSYTMNVPVGIQVSAIIGVRMIYNSSSGQGLVTSLDQTDAAPGQTQLTLLCNGNNTDPTVVMNVRTNTSGQIRYRQSDANPDVMIFTYGWIDERL